MADASEDFSSELNDPTALLEAAQRLAHSDPRAALELSLRATRAALTPEQIATAQVRAVVKDQPRRFQISMVIAAQMLEEGPALVRGDRGQRFRDWRLCVASTENLWRASAALWLDGFYGPATALAITSMEETGKLAVERFRLWGVAEIEITEPMQRLWNVRRSPFRDHATKSVMAAMAGALVNARVDRILGLQFINEFLECVEQKRLGALRESCLYLDRGNGALQTPESSIEPTAAARYIALAGEVLAEILPDPPEWERFLGRVQAFERAAELPYD